MYVFLALVAFHLPNKKLVSNPGLMLYLGSGIQYYLQVVRWFLCISHSVPGIAPSTGGGGGFPGFWPGAPPPPSGVWGATPGSGWGMRLPCLWTINVGFNSKG
jgi:hypothetical protein